MSSCTRPSDSGGDPAAIRRAHCGTACLLLGFTAGLLVLTDLAARSETVAAVLESRRLAEWRRNTSQYEYTLSFQTFEERLLYDELPRADYSRGSVIVVGASNVKQSLLSWELSPAQRAVIHNYGLSAASFTQQDQFLRYLVEQDGLLAAGGGKVLVLFGLFYGNAVRIEHRPNGGVVPNVFQRHGLYTWSHEGGIRSVPMSGIERFLRMEWIRCSGLFHARAAIPTPPSRPELHQQRWREYMGSAWEDELRHECGVFAGTLDYLLRRNVRVRGILLPLGSWHDPLPFPVAFRRAVESICGDRGVPLTDLTRLLKDEEFADSVHPWYSGQVKLHDALLKIVLAHCRRQGLLPEGAAAESPARR